MAAKKRNRIQIRADRLRIAELYIRGSYQSEIAETLGLSQQQISYDLRAIQREWLKTTTIKIDAHKTKELARIDHLERTYWQEWEESQKETKIKTVKTRGRTPGNTDRILKAEERHGDPRYLQGVQWCIEQRCKLLGIYQQAEISGLVINLVSSKEVNIDNC